MARLRVGLALLLASVGLFPLHATVDGPELQTVAEKSDFKETSRYADVVVFCDELARRSPLVHRENFGTTVEGRKLPVLVIAEPPIASAKEAAASGKLVVLAFANIHAGEVDGKEALLALARELTTEKQHPLLKHLVILLVPILNADGNEKFAGNNRPGQNGPALTGTRENANGFDLNRDFVKLETPEVRALVKFVQTWNPAVVIDCHTTNGSKHRCTLTFDGPRYPSGQSQLCTWSNNTLLRHVHDRVKKETGFDTAPYGNFSADRTKWETYPAGPRFGVQYFSLCGRIGILSESYSYASFADRVKASQAFVKACFETAAEQRDVITKLTDTRPPWPSAIVTRTRTIAFPGTISIPGFEEEQKDGKLVATERKKEYALEYIGQVSPSHIVKRPQMGYLIPAEFTDVIHTIRRHGIAVEVLREDIQLDVESYLVTRVDVTSPDFQKHLLVSVEGQLRAGSRMIPAGTVLVRTTQPFGTLAAYLLEPHSEDGLTTWGFFNEVVVPGKDFPVLRLPRERTVFTGEPQPLPEDRPTPVAITDDVLFGPRAPQFGPSFGGVAWLPDGEHYLQTKQGKLQKVNARTGTSEPFVDPEKVKKSLEAIADLKPEEIASLSKGTFSRMNKARTGFLFDMGQDLAFAYFDGTPGVRLTTKAKPGKEFTTLAPVGTRVAYVRDGNLFAASADNPGEQQLTTDGGKNDILNARGDWVYEEEIFLRNGRAFWWSPDGTKLAFLRFDDTPVKRFNLVDNKELTGRLEAYPYPKVGDPNPTVKLGVVAASVGKPAFLDLTGYPAADTLISRVGWLPSGKVYAYVQNRTQTWLDFVVWDSVDAKPKKLFRETTKAWVEDLGEPEFLADGSFLIASERTGFKHLYHYQADGTLLRPVTTGDWEIRDVQRLDEKGGHVYFTGKKDGHTVTHLYRVRLDGKDLERLTPAGGTHQTTVAPAGSLFIDRFSDPATPTQTVLREAGKEEPVRVLDSNPATGKENLKGGKIERVQVPMKDGFVLEGQVMYPPNFDPAKKYPIWVLTYAGPNAPTVRDSYGAGRGSFDQALAASGIVVFRIDPRSASGHSAAATWTCYKQLGVQELKDLEEAVAWLCKNPWADASRVGISGHSYGGFMAAYALTHSKTFSAGIASSGVMDWHLYDSIYTERYMLTPKENAEGYEKTSCIKAAKNLHGKLLIIHGMMDDNVHMQNSTQFIDALQRANKDFEMMFYPQARHGTGGPHLNKLELDFIRRAMGVK